MKISKHVHSCLLVEEAGKTILIDPGEYTYKEKVLDLNALNNLDYLLITHQHTDHMHLPLIKNILEKFPEVKIMSNQSVAEILNEELGCDVSIHGNNDIQLTKAPHEKALSNPPPKNVLFTIANKLTHPGDSITYNNSTEILAMPIVGSWASTVTCLDQAIKVKPKIVIPIHDWHWKDEARKWYYQKAKEYLKNSGIEFKGINTAEVIEV